MRRIYILLLLVFTITGLTAKDFTVVIDAGHGGEDGGAVAKDGTVEADINLAIALKAEALAKMCGREVVMTRREDVSIHDPSSATLREKKVSDLNHRVEIVENQRNPVLVSIHQNSFSDSHYATFRLKEDHMIAECHE